MKQGWFKRVGWLHIPISLPGVLLTLLAVMFCVNVFLAVDRHSHSASDTLYGIFPFFACTFLLLEWIARSTSRSVVSLSICPLLFTRDLSGFKRFVLPFPFGLPKGVCVFSV